VRGFSVLSVTLLACGGLAHTVPSSDASLSDGAPVDEAGLIDGRAHPREAGSPDAALFLDCSVQIPTCGPGAPCPDGGCCVAGDCVVPGEICAENLGTCRDQSCGGCGALNEPCCPLSTNLTDSTCVINPPGSAGWWDGPACSDPNAVCADAGAGANQCVACGAAGQLCCADALAKAPLGTCGDVQLVCGTDGKCTANCDHLGQPCCDDGMCLDGTVCMSYPTGTNDCVAGSTCDADGGACSTCGLVGLPCCAEEGCTEGICASGTCYVNTMR
jgi:hypothetical protein